jgi:ribosomal protein S18 acetylase RimI-like enzyme
MTSAEAASGLTIRKLRGDDLEAVVAIDRSVVGRPRGPFYQRRFDHLEREPDAFVALAAERDGVLAGFVLARLYEGEFGGDAPEAALDAIGVAFAWRGQGVAGALLAQLVDAMRAQGVRAIATEAEWSDTGLTGFFARAGFCLSPHIVLERRVDGSAA